MKSEALFGLSHLAKGRTIGGLGCEGGGRVIEMTIDRIGVSLNSYQRVVILKEKALSAVSSSGSALRRPNPSPSRCRTFAFHAL